MEFSPTHTPELGNDAYQAAAAFVGLRSNSDGDFRFDKTLLLSLKTSLAYVEKETGFALLERSYVAKGTAQFPSTLSLSRHLPVRLTVAKSDGYAVALSSFQFVPKGEHWALYCDRPTLKNAELQIQAGFEGWAMFPKDIQMSILKITAYHFEQRETPNRPWPQDVCTELSGYKTMRLGFTHEA